MAMIEDAEKRGILKKDTVIIEPTSGNTGIALSSPQRGLSTHPHDAETMSLGCRTLLAMLGANWFLTGGRHEGRDCSRRSARERDAEFGFRSSLKIRRIRRFIPRRPRWNSGTTRMVRLTSQPLSARAGRLPAFVKSSNRRRLPFKPSRLSRRILRSFPRHSLVNP